MSLSSEYNQQQALLKGNMINRSNWEYGSKNGIFANRQSTMWAMLGTVRETSAMLVKNMMRLFCIFRVERGGKVCDWR